MNLRNTNLSACVLATTEMQVCMNAQGETHLKACLAASVGVGAVEFIASARGGAEHFAADASSAECAGCAAVLLQRAPRAVG